MSFIIRNPDPVLQGEIMNDNQQASHAVTTRQMQPKAEYVTPGVSRVGHWQQTTLVFAGSFTHSLPSLDTLFTGTGDSNGQ